MKKVLIPIDGSEFSARALEKGKEVAKACGSEVILLHVVHVDLPSYLDFTSSPAVDASLDSVRAAAEENGKTILEEGKVALGDAALSVKLMSIPGTPADMIVRTADDEGVEMIIMGSEGMGPGSKGFLLGSVTNRVLHNTKLPVLVVK
jgi:nucleotide-binding universal stress UspA family protein